MDEQPDGSKTIPSSQQHPEHCTGEQSKQAHGSANATLAGQSAATPSLAVVEQAGGPIKPNNPSIRADTPARALEIAAAEQATVLEGGVSSTSQGTGNGQGEAASTEAAHNDSSAKGLEAKVVVETGPGPGQVHEGGQEREATAEAEEGEERAPKPGPRGKKATRGRGRGVGRSRGRGRSREPQSSRAMPTDDGLDGTDMDAPNIEATAENGCKGTPDPDTPSNPGTHAARGTRGKQRGRGQGRTARNSTPDVSGSTERRTTRSARRSSIAVAVPSASKQEEGPPEAADAKPGKEVLEGLRCEVWWDGEQAFFKGRIVKYVPDRNVYQVDYDDGDYDAGLQINSYEVVTWRNQPLVRVLQGDSISPELYLIAPPVAAAAGNAPGALAAGALDGAREVVDRVQTGKYAELADEPGSGEGGAAEGTEGVPRKAIPQPSQGKEAMQSVEAAQDGEKLQSMEVAPVSQGSNKEAAGAKLSQPAEGSDAAISVPRAPNQAAAQKAMEGYESVPRISSSQGASAGPAAAPSPQTAASKGPPFTGRLPGSSRLGLSAGAKPTQDASNGPKPAAPSSAPVAPATTASALRRTALQGLANRRPGEAAQKSTCIRTSSSSLLNSLAGSPPSGGSGSGPAGQKTTRLGTPAHLRPLAEGPPPSEQPQPARPPKPSAQAPQLAPSPASSAENVQRGHQAIAAAAQAFLQSRLPALRERQAQPKLAPQAAQQKQLPAQLRVHTTAQAPWQVDRQQVQLESGLQAGRQTPTPAAVNPQITHEGQAPITVMSLSAARGRLHWMPESPPSSSAAPEPPLYREAPLQGRIQGWPYRTLCPPAGDVSAQTWATSAAAQYSHYPSHNPANGRQPGSWQQGWPWPAYAEPAEQYGHPQQAPLAGPAQPRLAEPPPLPAPAHWSQEPAPPIPTQTAATSEHQAADQGAPLRVSLLRRNSSAAAKPAVMQPSRLDSEPLGAERNAAAAQEPVLLSTEEPQLLDNEEPLLPAVPALYSGLHPLSTAPLAPRIIQESERPRSKRKLEDRLAPQGGSAIAEERPGDLRRSSAPRSREQSVAGQTRPSQAAGKAEEKAPRDKPADRKDSRDRVGEDRRYEQIRRDAEERRRRDAEERYEAGKRKRLAREHQQRERRSEDRHYAGQRHRDKGIKRDRESKAERERRRAEHETQRRSRSRSRREDRERPRRERRSRTRERDAAQEGPGKPNGDDLRKDSTEQGPKQPKGSRPSSSSSSSSSGSSSSSSSSSSSDTSSSDNPPKEKCVDIGERQPGQRERRSQSRAREEGADGGNKRQRLESEQSKEPGGSAESARQQALAEVAQLAKEKLANAIGKRKLSDLHQELIPDKRRFKNGRVFTCSAVDEGKCIRENVVGGQRPSDIEEVDEFTAIFLYNTQSQDLAGIFTGDEDPMALKNPALKKGPFMYQVPMRKWRPAKPISVSAARKAVGPHPNPNGRCPIKEYLQAADVMALCTAFAKHQPPTSQNYS